MMVSVFYSIEREDELVEDLLVTGFIHNAGDDEQYVEILEVTLEDDPWDGEFTDDEQQELEEMLAVQYLKDRTEDEVDDEEDLVDCFNVGYRW